MMFSQIIRAIRGYVLILLVPFFFMGCAERVTADKGTAQDVFHLDVKLASEYTSDAYRYYLILSDTPLSGAYPGKGWYLFVPGQSDADWSNGNMPVSAGSTSDARAQFYYQQFFSLWREILVMDSTRQSFSVYPTGNYFPNQATAARHYQFSATTVLLDTSVLQAGQSPDASFTLYLEVGLNRLHFSPIKGQTLYYMLITMLPSSYIVYDMIADSIPFKNEETGSLQQTGSDSVQGNCDILSWRARIL